ncbi:hypothetical protein RM549_00535 [Salegentibacter sp. F188]|uniref:Uncharacterized protein n=1 Tax=Autumnicola patrickiae TaxID=3075591 RepID=A0ABU3DX11_9FLAO|nr:hypothetical protein [Salegentibacter sp. F188]MDT0688254.1 hypothetical protein [Salegentibacter sp. F188]
MPNLGHDFSQFSPKEEIFVEIEIKILVLTLSEQKNTHFSIEIVKIGAHLPFSPSIYRINGEKMKNPHLIDLLHIFVKKRKLG